MRTTRFFLILIASIALLACPVFTACSGEELPEETKKEEQKEPDTPKDPEDDNEDPKDDEGSEGGDNTTDPTDPEDPKDPSEPTEPEDPKIDPALATSLQNVVEENIPVIQKLLSVDCLSTCNADNAAGNAVIGFADGTSVTVNTGSNGHPMLTAVLKDGAYFWALIKNGAPEIIRIGNEDLSVNSTPRFRLSEKGEWEMTVGESEDWQATGLSVDIAATEYAIDFFKEVTVSGNQAQIVLTGDTSISLPVVGDGVITVDQSSVWYTRLNQKKEFKLTTYNVKSMTVTGIPDEWIAEISGNSLFVTSPSVVTDVNKGGNVEVTAEFEGNGKTAAVSVEVQYDKELTLTADAYGLVKVVISEHVANDYRGYILKAWPLADFTTESVLAWLNGEGRNTAPQTQSKEYNISEICDAFKTGTAYKIFAISAIAPEKVASAEEVYTASNLQTAEYTPATVSIDVSNIRFDGATINASYNDITRYFAGISTASDWTNYVRKNFLEMLGWGGQSPLTAPSFTGDASRFPSGEPEIIINPSTEYIVWVMPEKTEGGYTEDDFITKSFTTPGVESGAQYEAPAYTVTDRTYGGFTAVVTPAAGAYKTYAAILPIGSIPSTDLETVTLLINTNKYSEGSSSLTVTTNSYSSDDEVYLLAVSVNADGKYGKVLKDRVELKKLNFSDAIGIEDCKVEYGLGDVTLTLTFKGNPTSISYFAATYTYYTEEILQKMMAMGQYGDVIDKKIANLTNGNQLYFTGLELGVEHTLYALVKDNEGNPSHLFTKTFTPSIGIDYIMSSSNKYEYGMPQISGTWKSKTSYELNVNMPAECVRYWIQVCDKEYLTGDVYIDTDKLVTLTGYACEEHSAPIRSKVYSYLNSNSRVFIAWLDNNGEYHAIYEFNPHQ